MDSDIVFLVTVSNSYEFSMVRGILDDNNIPFLVRDEGIGDFLRISTGAVLSAIHVFVNKIDLERSKKLLINIGFKFKKTGEKI